MFPDGGHDGHNSHGISTPLLAHKYILIDFTLRVDSLAPLETVDCQVGPGGGGLGGQLSVEWDGEDVGTYFWEDVAEGVDCV